MGIFGFGSAKPTQQVQQFNEYQSAIEALSRSMAVIEFTVDGHIITANNNFLIATGYSLAEIQNKHHSMFCFDDLSHSPEYKEFWAKLANGDFMNGQFQRRHANGEELWLEASYSPVRDENGQVYKVIKFASDITEQVQKSRISESLISALNASQAVIEFTPDGTILTANDNFCQATGYELSALVGKHHRMFVKPDYVNSAEYESFWKRLANGEIFGGRFERVRADGSQLWLEATYNPIFNEKGQVYKVVKFASDITERIVQQLHDSDNAVRAYDLAEETDRVAQKGVQIIHDAAHEMSSLSQIVSETSEAVTDLANHSEQITTIVNTIRGIAEQTNLLALNAAIEAACAGDQGRGFAVVADEVRQLAGRTSESTQEISDTIDKVQQLTSSAIKSMESCQQQAGSSAELASQAGNAIEDIKQGISHVVDAVSIFKQRIQS